VPFILAAVTLLVMGLFLSLCDPSHNHHDDHKAGAAHNQHDMHATDKDAHGPEPATAPADHSAPSAEGEQHH
jgi:hypothetical protein